MKKTRTITWCAVFCALGALLPQAFHVFGAVSGQMFLPMHIPAMLAGCLLGPTAGLVTGLVSPVLSHLITGGSMPILVKVPFMMLEIGAYGLFCGLFFRKILVRIKLPQLLNAVLAVLASQIAGRVINVLCTMFAVQVLGVQHKAVSVAAAVGSIGAGLPGIVIQLLFIPALVVTLLKILERHAAGFDGK